MLLEGKNAVITGGSRGIGAAIVLASDLSCYVTVQVMQIDGGLGM